MDRVNNFIDNQFLPPQGGQFLVSLNPATAEQIAEIADSDARDIELAVQAAKKAYPLWSAKTSAERSQYLYRIADLIEKRALEFAELESRDQGKPVKLANEMDIARVILNFRFFAGAILHTENESTVHDNRTFNYVARKSIGVAGLISPWNLPLYLLTWKIAPAIVSGNTVVCKPSEFTSLTASLFAEVIAQVLPAGVVNIVFGTGAKAGEALVKHPDVPLISFTGGTETGKRILRDSAESIKKVSLELGGKNPNIIFADCDFEAAIANSIRAGFLNQGEICLCGSRIYVEDSLYDRFVQRYVQETQKLIVGDPGLPETFMGPLVSASHYQKVLSYLEVAKAEGGQILCGGQRPQLPEKFSKGYFLNPTVIAGLSESSKCIQDEIFGPVVTISRFSGVDDAITKANGVRYGLSASVWTANLSQAHRLAAELKVGTVWINSWLVRDLRLPFGGMKASGLGREGGRHSLEFFTEPTTVCVRYS